MSLWKYQDFIKSIPGLEWNGKEKILKRCSEHKLYKLNEIGWNIITEQQKYYYGTGPLGLLLYLSLFGFDQWYPTVSNDFHFYFLAYGSVSFSWFIKIKQISFID